MYEEVIKRREKERQAEELKIENCKTEARCFAKANKKKSLKILINHQKIILLSFLLLIFLNQNLLVVVYILPI